AHVNAPAPVLYASGGGDLRDEVGVRAAEASPRPSLVTFLAEGLDPEAVPECGVIVPNAVPDVRTVDILDPHPASVRRALRRQVFLADGRGLPADVTHPTRLSRHNPDLGELYFILAERKRHGRPLNMLAVQDHRHVADFGNDNLIPVQPPVPPERR